MRNGLALVGIALHCLWFCLGCNPLDPSLLDRLSTSADSGSPDAGKKPSPGDGGGPDSGDADSGECEPSTEQELCNGLDDNCNGVVDEGAEVHCAESIINAVTACVRANGRSRCVKTACMNGFDDCNGDPIDGCECPSVEDDGGTEDGG